MQSETLPAVLGGAAEREPVEQTVRALGYKVSGVPDEALGQSARGEPSRDDHAGHAHADRDHASAGHSDPGEAIDGAWWSSTQGKLVIVSGAVLAIAYLAHLAYPAGTQVMFLAAAAVGAFPVARRALAALRMGSLFTIEMLMTIAVVGAVAIGAAEEAAIVVFLFAVGELLEGVAAGRARSGIRALAKIAPQTAMLEAANGVVETPVANIKVGDIVIVRPGDRVPSDGVIVSGRSALDESALTGESMPRGRGEGDLVLAGSINAEAVLRVRGGKPAGETTTMTLRMSTRPPPRGTTSKGAGTALPF
ncbi:hypothetical protein WDZ92_44385, partial [Nostoc sp. NIES-2111]